MLAALPKKNYKSNMNKNSENLYYLIFCISFLGVWFVNLLYSPIHKYLRSEKVYYILLIVSTLMLIVSYNQVEPNWEKYQKVNALAPILILTYIILYKLADYIALKKYNRHMYFYCRISYYMEDEEARESTLLENLMQFSILIISMFIWWTMGTFIAENYI